ncbi:MAG: hypothetical protein ACRETA_02725 [Gammaproteobacteria bacterium]
MNTHPFLTGLQDNPDFLLQNLDFQNQSGLIVKIDERAYRQASFLDERVFSTDTQGAWFPFQTLLEATTGLTIQKAPHFIFHIGHCGSTLISRLLGELPETFSLREPIAPLALAVIRREMGADNAPLDMETWRRLFAMSLTSLSRTYNINDRPIIKLTSAAGNLLEPVLQANAASKALLLYVDLETWLAIMLRAEATRENLHAYSGVWLKDFQRLTGRDDIQLQALDDTRQAVISWLTMMLSFQLADKRYPGRTQWLNFDDFLLHTTEHLASISEFFGLQLSTQQSQELPSSPLLRSYSKIPTQAFNPGLRTQELQEAQTQFHDEIQKGLRWAEELCRDTPALDQTRRYLHNDDKIA